LLIKPDKNGYIYGLTAGLSLPSDEYLGAMNLATRKKTTPGRYPCHCCHKKESVSWSQKRQCFICDNCLKTFDAAIIARRNGMLVEQLTLC